MKHSLVVKTIKRYYDNGLYTKEDVYKFVTNGNKVFYLTEEEYKEIVKEK